MIAQKQKKFNLNSWLKNQTSKPRPRIVCADGFNMSVQAGFGMYSTPREEYSFYTAVEVGFPSQCEPNLLRYAEDWAVPTKTVYGYVPIEVVENIINKHNKFKVSYVLGKGECKGPNCADCQYSQQGYVAKFLVEHCDGICEECKLKLACLAGENICLKELLVEK